MAPGITMMDYGRGTIKARDFKKCAANVPSTPTGFLPSHCVYIASGLLQWLDINYFIYPLRTPQIYYCEYTLFV